MAATALATGAALAGAGVAASEPQIVTDSPSLVSVERDTDGDVVVTYDNRSGRDLLCEFDVLPQDLLEAYYDYHLRGTSASEELLAAIAEAKRQGQYALGETVIAAGAVGGTTFNEDQADPGSGFPLVESLPTDREFAPAVFSWCTAVVDGTPSYSYIEIEKAVAAEVDDNDDNDDDGSVGGGGAGIFSSLELLFGS